MHAGGRAIKVTLRGFGAGHARFPGKGNTPPDRPDGIDKRLLIRPENIAQTVSFVLSMSETVCPENHVPAAEVALCLTFPIANRST
jgi:hypothetical protein